MTLRALIACETSGRVREAMRARGIDATSVDLLPSEDGSNHHITDDVRNWLDDRWDLLAVMHPPCTRLCKSGQHWIYGKNKTHPKRLPSGKTWSDMKRELQEGADLFSDCWNAPIPLIAVENPIMNPHAKELIRNYQDPAQTVQPWWFGEPYFKGTSFYLKGLPPLVATNKLTPPKRGTETYKAWSYIHRLPPGPNRWKERSRTFPGIAEAIADQWGSYALQQAA